MSLKIGNSKINDNSNTYFIADIGANHDGSLERAKRLIKMCAEAGANVQVSAFKAGSIVSDDGFKNLDKKYLLSSNWSKSVLKYIKMLPLTLLGITCKKRDYHGIEYMTLHMTVILLTTLIHRTSIQDWVYDITWIEHMRHCV